MSLPREDLLLAEMLMFRPLDGEFDVEFIAEAVKGIGQAYQDEFEPSAFALFTSAEARDACRAARQADQTSTFPYVPIVMLKPNQIAFYPVSDQEDLRAVSAQFLEWLLARYDCQIENDLGTDVTEPPPPEEPSEDAAPASDSL